MPTIDRTTRQGRTGRGFPSTKHSSASHNPRGCGDDGDLGTETIVRGDFLITKTTHWPRR